MYVAVKGGEKAIEAAHELLAEKRRGELGVPTLSTDQIREQMSLAVARVMSEGSLYDPDLAALAIKQARGDLIEAIFLLRAFRTTLPRFGYSVPLATDAMTIERRISATYKDLPGGQVLGPTFDYTHRLLDPNLMGDGTVNGPVTPTVAAPTPEQIKPNAAPHVTGLLNAEGLIETNPEASPDAPVGDLTRDPLDYPVERDTRLQALARGDEGFLLALGYSTQRGYGRTHPFAGEIRMGEVEVFFEPEEVGFEVPLGSVTVTECEMVNQFAGSTASPPKFTRGYGLVFGHAERKAMAMALVDRSLRARDLAEDFMFWGPATFLRVRRTRGEEGGRYY
ncbi:MAG: carbon-phosphorus lyase complex subunit PhnI, partial [Pseudomonadota bacterium]